LAFENIVSARIQGRALLLTDYTSTQVQIAANKYQLLLEYENQSIGLMIHNLAKGI
jgi:hypothetical protein